MFLIIFLLIPLIEIALFIIIGERIGIGATLLFALITAMIGGSIVRNQGLKAFTSGQEKLRQGGFPGDDLFTGFCLVIAGALLITPGFATDVIGFSLLVPPIRHLLKAWLLQRVTIKTDMRDRRGHSKADDNVEIVDVEYEEVEKR